MTQNVKLSLRYKFLAIMVALLSAAILAYLILAVSLFHDDKKGYVYDSNASLANLLASETQTTLNSSVKTLRVLAAAYLQNYTNSEEKAKNLQQIFSEDENLAAVTLFEAQSTSSQQQPVIELINPSYLKPYNLSSGYFESVRKQRPTDFAILQKKPFYIHNASLPNGAPLMALAIPFTLDQSNIVKLYALAYLRQDLLLKIFTYSQMYQTYLMDNAGRTLVHPDSKLVTSQFSFSENPTIKEIIKSKTPNGAKEYLSKTKQAYILAYAKLDTFELTVVSEIERDKAFLAARKLVEKSVFFAMLIVFVAIIVSVLFTKRLTSSLKTLYEATLNIARGDFSVRVNVQTGDEIGSLAQSFNTMAGRITDLMQQTADKARLERELDTARMVQGTFFPEKTIKVGPMSVVGLYQPASQCGGDWWGHFSTAQGLQYVFIADAMGHGVPAALVTAMAYSSFMSAAELVKADALHQHSPAKLLELFNKILYDALRGKISMTFFAAVIDFDKAQMTYANGGHNFPILIPSKPADDRAGAAAKKKTDVISTISLQLQGSPLGLDRNAVFEQKTIDLRPGDKLFMFTDGLIEGRSPSGPQWGRKNLIKQLVNHANYGCDDVKNLILNDALQFFSGRPPDDDITVVVLEMSKTWSTQQPNPIHSTVPLLQVI